MVAHPISTAKFYKILKAVTELFAVKYNIKQLNNVWLNCFSNKDTLSEVMSSTNPCIQKYVKKSLQKIIIFIIF